MKNEKMNDAEDEMKAEYDFETMQGGVQGKYAQSYAQGTNLVHLEADVAAVFTTEESVNQALRSLIVCARKYAAAAK